MPLREYAGAAKRTALVGDITATSTNLTVSDATGYPTGATAPFVIAIDAGVAAEEKVLVASRSGNTLTVAAGGRGFDGTTAAAHGAGSVIDHVLSATDVREANAHVNAAHVDPTTVVSKAGGDTITASAATVIPLVVRGAASQTANLFEARSAGTTLGSWQPNGSIALGFGSTTTGGNLLALLNSTAPTANLGSGGQLYTDGTGRLLWRGGGGTVTVIAPS